MKTARLDSGSAASHWTEFLKAGQYVLFHRDFQWIWLHVLGLKCMIVATALRMAGFIGLRKEPPGDNRQRI